MSIFVCTLGEDRMTVVHATARAAIICAAKEFWDASAGELFDPSGRKATRMTALCEETGAVESFDVTVEYEPSFAAERVTPA